jgi:hypothetical protein
MTGTASATVYILLRTEMAEFQQTNRDGDRVTMTGAVLAAVCLLPHTEPHLSHGTTVTSSH